MKKLFLFIITLSLSNLLTAQDTIVKSNGEQIRAKIIEITANQIKYKKFNFLDGPTYVENKADLQLIKYSNGTKDTFRGTPIQTQEIVQLPDTISKDRSTPIKVIVKKQDSIPRKTEPIPVDEYYQPEKGTPVVVQKKDDISKTPEKAVSDDYYKQSESTGRRSGQLSVSKMTFKQNETIITEKEFYNLLKQSNDKEIIALVEKAGRAKKRQYIYFICMVANTTMLVVPALYIVIEPAFIFPYFRNRAVRKTCNKRAIELYNKK